MQKFTELVQFRRCLAAVLAALSFPSCAAFAAAPTYTLETASLTGPGYDTASGGRYGGITSLNASGQIVGYSDRYASAGTQLGYDTWLHSGGTTKVINLTGAAY